MKDKLDPKLQSFILHEVKKFHENMKKSINEEEAREETPAYKKNVYEGYDKDIQEVVSKLAETANLIESCIAKQRGHQKNLPEINERMDESKQLLEMLVEIYKDVKGTKLKAERRMYEK